MEEHIENQHSVTDVFNNSSKYLKSKIGTTIEVETVQNKIYQGVLYVADKSSKTIVLIKYGEENKIHLHLFTDHGIKHVKFLSDEVDLTLLSEVEQEKNKCCSEMLLERKAKIKKWFEKNFLEVIEEGDKLKFQDHLVIYPPYEVNDCYSESTIVLNRVKDILEKMPNDI